MKVFWNLYLNKVKYFPRRKIKYVNGDSFPPPFLSAASSDTRLFCLLEYKYFCYIISFSFIYEIFFVSEPAKYRRVSWETVTDVIVIIWAAAAMWIAVKKSYWQYLIECHSGDAVTKSHTTKIVTGSYCTKMSVICVKSPSFVWHERIIILYRMCIWYLRGWTRPE